MKINTGQSKEVICHSHKNLPSEWTGSIARVSSLIGWCNEEQGIGWTIVSMKRLDDRINEKAR